MGRRWPRQVIFHWYGFLVETPTLFPYASLGMRPAKRLAHEAEEMVGQGLQAIKFKIGFPGVKTDLEVIRAVRSAVGNEIVLMVDYNQCLSISEEMLRSFEDIS